MAYDVEAGLQRLQAWMAKHEACMAGSRCPSCEDLFRVTGGAYPTGLADNPFPQAPAEALAENDWWNGPRCACGLPALRSIIDKPGHQVFIHPYWQDVTGAWLNEHPHNVQIAE